MTDIPQSSDEIQLGHHIVHYTFMPMVICVFLGTLSPLVLWPLGYIDMPTALRISWVSVLVVSVYLWFFGDYIIPDETYLKVRSGEWDNSNE